MTIPEDPVDRFISEVKDGYLPTAAHKRAWALRNKGPLPPPDFIVEPLEAEPKKFWDGTTSMRVKELQYQKLLSEGHPYHCAGGLVWMGASCICGRSSP